VVSTVVVVLDELADAVFELTLFYLRTEQANNIFEFKGAASAIVFLVGNLFKPQSASCTGRVFPVLAVLHQPFPQGRHR
jgi:hypothetical protein